MTMTAQPGARPHLERPAVSWLRPARSLRSALSLVVDLLLAIIAVAVSVLLHPWVVSAGDTQYQEFLRMEWVLAAGGKGVQLDPLSLPLAPLLHVSVAAVVGQTAAEMWLPILLSVGILLVLTRVLLHGYPLGAKLLAAALMLASPPFYLLQRDLHVQLFVLLLGLQLSTLRSFRLNPTVSRVTLAIGLNILLSLTSFTAVIAIAAAMVYLLFSSSCQDGTSAAAWRALLWLYAPFSLSGYAVWAIAWGILGSRLRTSLFQPDGPAGPGALQQLLSGQGAALVLPLLLLCGLTALLWIFVRHPETRMRGGRTQTVGWAVVAFMSTASVLIVLQVTLPMLSVVLELASSLILLVPAALGSVYGQARNVLRLSTPWTRLALAAAGAGVLALFALTYIVRPVTGGVALPPVAARAAVARAAAAGFAARDPGGRILLDPRFTADFVLASRIDPHRLLTPFDRDFARLVAAPPRDVRAVVLSDTPADLVNGNYPAERVADLLPDAHLLTAATAHRRFVRVFARDSMLEPTVNASPKQYDPTVRRWENVILTAVLREMDKRKGLPARPETSATAGWAYAVDMGTLLDYAAARGDAHLFRLLSDRVKKFYLITRSDDINALYTVAWRAWPGHALEASGTTETLRMVDGYWTAGQRWHNPYYLRLAHLMARAYMRHQTSNQYGLKWYIRNYYNYETKNYATNTFLVDYAPDVLWRVAIGTHDSELRKAADKAAEFVEGAQLPFGFFHEMYQPEISTLYANMKYFSPNGIMQIIDAHEAAMGISTHYAPRQARRTYRFDKAHYRHITYQYYMSGRPVGFGKGDAKGPAIYAFMARLAVRMGDPSFAHRLIAVYMNPRKLYADPKARPGNDSNWFFGWTSVLQAMGEYQLALNHTHRTPASAARLTAL